LIEDRQGLTGLERIYFNRGHELYHAKKYEMAIDDYSKAIHVKPNFPYAYSDRAASLLELKRFDEALIDFELALKLKPGYPRSLMGRGLALEGLARMAEAKEAYRTACSQGWTPACKKIIE
jgi:protein O-GlcNAc transferase